MKKAISPGIPGQKLCNYSFDYSYIKVEYTYKDENLVAINYEFFDLKTNKIGYFTYNSDNKTVEAKRLK